MGHLCLPLAPLPVPPFAVARGLALVWPAGPLRPWHATGPLLTSRRAWLSDLRAKALREADVCSGYEAYGFRCVKKPPQAAPAPELSARQ
jgi:hypothetical protein